MTAPATTPAKAATPGKAARPGKATTAKRRTDDKRQRILDAAVQVFARKGFFASRISDIATAAGIADGTVYLYFESKDNILIKLFDEVMGEHIEAARQEAKRVVDAAAQLRVIADHHLGLLGRNPDLAVVFQVEVRQSTKFMELFTASWLMEYFDIVEAAIEAGQKQGTFRKDLSRKLATHAFFGALDALVTSWVLARNAFDLMELAGPVVELFLTGAAAKAPPRRR
ncbi:MAG: TetR/AcrR family transcriptional regulator, fatty acid metabolism regulator protein [Myxococcales bacterium]|nr:TetR/AcrR family transcriptional regulator, fatty acid metabolism regulator protein [Myxococcales bacterium]